MLFRSIYLMQLLLLLLLLLLQLLLLQLLLLLQQIGRASCRERVCHCV